MTTIPDDHYGALGVAKDATAAAIKLAYRKLVLKHHPDKVDDSDKAAASDRFHKIQTAYETIGDEEKRGRYDAHVKLATLRKEREQAEKDRFPPTDHRPAPFRSATTARPSPQAPSPRGGPFRGASFVEVKPSFDGDIFDRVRTSDRRDFDFDHGRSHRTPPKEERHKIRLPRQDSKDSERRGHREKGRINTKNTNRERDLKHNFMKPEFYSDSESDGYDRRSPRIDQERAREAYFDQVREQQEHAKSNHYMNERTQRMFSDAQDYQQRMRKTEIRRPSPTRMSSSRESLEYARMADGRPASIRRSSQRPRTSSRDDLEVPRSARRGSDRELHRSSTEYDEPARRPPGLNQTKSAPGEIHIPDKQRSNSVQFHARVGEDFGPPPVRRADSMPHAVSKERVKPVKRQSTLRHATTTDDYDDRRSSVRAQQSGGRSPRSYDDEPGSPDYKIRTEIREPRGEARDPKPVSRRYTESPSPIRGGDKSRSSSYRHVQPQPIRTSSKSHHSPTYESAERPPLSRGNSSRQESLRKDGKLFGEIDREMPRSPRERDPYSIGVEPRYREIRPDVKIQTGFSASSRRGSDGRSPSYYRANSYNTSPMQA